MSSHLPASMPRRFALAALPGLLALTNSASAQSSLEVLPLYPTAGAVSVPTNSSLRIEFRGALLESTERPLLISLLVADDADTLSGPADIAGFPFRTEEGKKLYESLAADQVGASDADGFDLQTEPIELLPNTRYQVQSNVATCSEGDIDVVCIGSTYQVLGEFETGDGPDESPPRAEWVGEADRAVSCAVRIRVQGEDDHTPPELIRYAQQGEVLVDLGLGPEVVVRGRPRDSTERDVATELVVPIDQSGNVGEPLELEVPTCFNPLAAYGSDLPPAADARSDTRVVGERAEGCSMSARHGEGWLWPAAMLALSALARRRGRRTTM